MSESQEYKLSSSLVWSNQEFSIAEFVKRYELPQVVLVVDGYCGLNERTTFGSGQILTLHTLHTSSKIVCQVPHGNAVMVPVSCPLKAEVIPMDCSDTTVTAYQLSTLYQKIKYVRVMRLSSTWMLDTLKIDTLKVNDILQIKKIDSKSSVIKCENLTTAQEVSILFNSTAVFVPLMDSNTYDLAEIEKKFGFPVKVRFSDKRAEMQMLSVPEESNPPKPSTYLSDLGQMTAIEEIEDSDVIVTTVCSNLEEKGCLHVPTTLDIKITVAEGFLRGDETYQRVVRTLDKQFNRTDLKDFENLDVYEHLDAVKKTMEEKLFVQDASTEVVERAHEHSQRAERKKSKRLSWFEWPPKLSFRRQDSAEQKAPAEQLPKAGQKADLKQKFNKKLKNIKFNTLPRLKRSNKKIPSNESRSIASGNMNEKPIEQPEGDYEDIDGIYEETVSHNSDSEDNYTELDTTNTPATPRLYEKYITEAPKAKETASHRPSTQSILLPSTQQTTKPPPLPTTTPPQTPEDKQEINKAISPFPQDLSGLSVEGVSRLLRHLNLSEYVQTFENELIDGMMLISLDQESFESLGVKRFHCKKLVDFIGGWRPIF